MNHAAQNTNLPLGDAFAKIPDPRAPSGKRFPLQGLLALAVAALLAGRQGLAAIARRGRECPTPQFANRTGGLGTGRWRRPPNSTSTWIGRGWRRRPAWRGGAPWLAGKALRSFSASRAWPRSKRVRVD